MTPRVPKNVSNWLADLSFVTIIGNAVQPRDPDDDDDAENEEDDDEPDDGPAVIREPDE